MEEVRVYNRKVPPNVTCLVSINEDTNTSKFWALSFEPGPDGVPVLRRFWGRIGTKGQEEPSAFPSEAICLQQAKAWVEAKLREGYRRVDRIGFDAPFLARADRAPTIEGYNDDGWPIVNGRAVRPPGRRGSTDLLLSEAMRRMATDTDRAMLRGLDTHDSFARLKVKKPTAPAPRPTVVVLSTERIIDFEE